MDQHGQPVRFPGIPRETSSRSSGEPRPPAPAGMDRRHFMLLGGTVVGGLGVAFTTGPAALAQTTAAPSGPQDSQLKPDSLQASAMTDPLGIDVTPALSWKLSAGVTRAPDGQAGPAQSAYQIQVASDPSLLRGEGRPDLWDSGMVPSSRNYQALYGGKAVPSRTRVAWRVRAWDERGDLGAWSEPACWETGLLRPADWTAHWIGNADWETPHPLSVSLSAPQTARYVRLTVTDLGRPAAPLYSAAFQPRLQLAEFALYNSSSPAVDLARGAAVTVSESDTVAGQWAPEYLTDGKITSATAPYGYQSTVHPDTDVSDQPIVLTLDLDTAATFDQAVIYQRWDAPSQWGITPDYPRSFTIAVADSPGGPFTTVASVKKDDKPYPPSSLHAAPAGLPLFARQFTAARREPVRRARLYVSCAGIHISTVNGKPATANVLEPPVSDVLDEVEYATYDVTSLIQPGRNSIGVELGTGTWDIFNTPAFPDRYIKATAGFGPPRLIAQLEIEYESGATQTVATDGTWLTSLGPTTFSNWYGGEDFDARRMQQGWNEPGTDLSAWTAAVQTAPPAPGTTLTGRLAPGIQIVETDQARAVTNPAPGVYVVDYGINAAGWQELTFNVPAGTVVTMRPAEKLKSDGTIDQSTTGSPIYDSYTSAGAPGEVWHPRFMYHGLRYLQVEGMPQAPAAMDARRHILRAANPESATFTCSDDLLNSIHTIINRAVQSNMFSTLTDCPHREKLGWLDDTGLIFDVAARNYDVAALYRKIVRDITEAQSPGGLVPTTAPELALFAGGFRDDPNWGGTVILAPWQMYRTYGDFETLRATYPAMCAYLRYLQTQAAGNLLDYGLGDWITLNSATPAGVTASYAYKRLASLLARIAALLGSRSDAATYSALADDITSAFNTQYYDAANATYGPGTQACNALALDAGFVPASTRRAVLNTLVSSISGNGNHLDVGEIGLPAVLRVLAGAGRHDVIYDIATQTTYPSYGYQVVTGSTSLGEDWGGMGTSGSQNHWMLGALDAWFTEGLGGIRQAGDSVAFQRLVIAPAVVGTLTSVQASYSGPQGRIATSWRRQDAALALEVTIPPNTTATVMLPLGPAGGRSAQVSATKGAVAAGNDGTTVTWNVGPGDWRFSAVSGS